MRFEEKIEKEYEDILEEIRAEFKKEDADLIYLSNLVVNLTRAKDVMVGLDDQTASQLDLVIDSVRVLEVANASLVPHEDELEADETIEEATLRNIHEYLADRGVY